jgi:Holliday junction resolvase
MARGKDKTIELGDIKNMSHDERGGLFNLVKMGKVKVKGTAVVRSADSGNARYEKPDLAGTYNEDKL